MKKTKTNRLPIDVEATYSLSYVLKAWRELGFELHLEVGGFSFSNKNVRFTFYLEEITLENTNHLTAHEASLIAATIPYVEPLINLKLMASHAEMEFTLMEDGSIFFGADAAADALATFHGKRADR